ncbi:hypothetical protein [Streptomyces chrestomyceticus]|uniref:hypothetical protein n=1 Tax=Streptomyces chrestomyceticus TaxID=68185 RepID=UPI00378E29C0
MSHSIDSALQVAQEIVERQVRDAQGFPSVGDFLEIMRNFEGEEFDVPRAANSDSDGFLFEYGRASWFAEPTFVLSCTRQLELVDASGEHEAYSQVLFEYRYRLDAELENLQHSLWWFRDNGTLFTEWIEAVRRDQIWRILQNRNPTAFEVTQEWV